MRNYTNTQVKKVTQFTLWQSIKLGLSHKKDFPSRKCYFTNWIRLLIDLKIISLWLKLAPTKSFRSLMSIMASFLPFTLRALKLAWYSVMHGWTPFLFIWKNHKQFALKVNVVIWPIRRENYTFKPLAYLLIGPLLDTQQFGILHFCH